MFYYMHNNNNYQCKMCWNKALTFGVGSIKLSCCTIVFTQYMQRCFNPNITTFQSNCAEGLHFSTFNFFFFFCLFFLFFFFPFLFSSVLCKFPIFFFSFSVDFISCFFLFVSFFLFNFSGALSISFIFFFFCFQ